MRTYELREDFDTVVCIGLLIFLDCPTALRQLRDLQAHEQVKSFVTLVARKPLGVT